MSPAGFAEKHETDLKQTAVRETYEETGIQLDQKDLISLAVETSNYQFAMLDWISSTHVFAGVSIVPNHWKTQGEKDIQFVSNQDIPDKKEIQGLYVISACFLEKEEGISELAKINLKGNHLFLLQVANKLLQGESVTDLEMPHFANLKTFALCF